MIETVHILNLQSHKDSILEFSPGVNVIKGTSHHGKSSIVRAIRWCLLNKPSGEGYKSHFADNKDRMAVGIEFDKSYVLRKRDKKFNGYEVNGTDLAAIRTDLPKEVTDVTNMNEVNISDQHTGYFFLQSSPGDIARALNEVVGLEIIDTSLKKGNSIIRDTKWALKVCNDDIEQLEEKLEKYKHLKNIEVLINRIEENKHQKQLALQKLVKLIGLTESIEREEKLKGEIKDWLTVKPKTGPIKKKLKKLTAVWKEYDLLSSTCRFIEMEEEAQINYKKAIAGRDKLKVIRSKIEELKETLNKLRNIESIYKHIDKEVSLQNSINMTLKALRKTFSDKQKQLETCPNCGAYRIHWRKR